MTLLDDLEVRSMMEMVHQDFFFAHGSAQPKSIEPERLTALVSVEQPWPGEGIIDLVQQSSGQFIYVVTVLKFISADFCSPKNQLALILKRDPTAFSDLNQFYTQILSVYPSTANIVQVLGTILAFDDDLKGEVIEDILGMEEGDLRLVLSGLSSLMEDEDDEDRWVLYNSLKQSFSDVVTYDVIPHFAHASFSDYLFDTQAHSMSIYRNMTHQENSKMLIFYLICLNPLKLKLRIIINNCF